MIIDVRSSFSNLIFLLVASATLASAARRLRHESARYGSWEISKRSTAVCLSAKPLKVAVRIQGSLSTSVFFGKAM